MSASRSLEQTDLPRLASQAVQSMFVLRTCDAHHLLHDSELAASSHGQTQTRCVKFCPTQPALCVVSLLPGSFTLHPDNDTKLSSQPLRFASLVSWRLYLSASTPVALGFRDPHKFLPASHAFLGIVCACMASYLSRRGLPDSATPVALQWTTSPCRRTENSK